MSHSYGMVGDGSILPGDYPNDKTPPFWVERNLVWLNGWYAGWMGLTVLLFFTSLNLVHKTWGSGSLFTRATLVALAGSLGAWSCYLFVIYEGFMIDSEYTVKVFFEATGTSWLFLALGGACHIWVEQYERASKYIFKTDYVARMWSYLNLFSCLLILVLWGVLVCSFIAEEEKSGIRDATLVVELYFAIQCIAFFAFCLLPLVVVHFLLDRERLRFWRRVDKHTVATIYFPALAVGESFMMAMWFVAAAYGKSGLRDNYGADLLRHVLNVHDVAKVPVVALIFLALLDYISRHPVERFLGIESAEVDVIPSSVDFGDVNARQGEAVSKIQIVNEGSSPLAIYGVAVLDQDKKEFVNSPFTVLSDTKQATLKKGERRVVAISFDPHCAGSISAFLQITTSDADEAIVLVPLEGRGTESHAEFKPSHLGFGTQPVHEGASVAVVAAVFNSSATSMELGDAIIVDDPEGEFTIVFDTGEDTLEEGEKRSFMIKFDPVTTGRRTARLRVVCDDEDGYASLTLEGEGTEADITVSPSEHVFGSQAVSGGFSPVKTFFVQNTGSAVLQLHSVTMSGEGHFVILDDTGEMTLHPGMIREIDVAFDPEAPGSQSGTLIINSNDTNGAVAVPLSGVGTEGILSVEPEQVDFGAIRTDGGSAQATLTIENDGDDDLEISAVELVGKFSNEFAITDDSGEDVLAPGAGREIVVTFDPLANGSKVAFLRVVADNASVDIPLDGFGASDHNLEVEIEDELEADVGEEAETAVTITNVGENEFEILEILIKRGAAFSITDDSGEDTLEPGDSRTLTVTFSPTENRVKQNGNGKFSGQLVVKTSTKEGVLNYTLAGEATNLPIAKLFEGVDSIANTCFVCDCSGSMQFHGHEGVTRLDLVKERVTEMIEDADENDTFNVVKFGNKANKCFDSAAPATDENKKRAIKFVNNMEAKGGTKSLRGLRMAFSDPSIKRVVLLQDGKSNSNMGKILLQTGKWANKRKANTLDCYALQTFRKPGKCERMESELRLIAKAGGGELVVIK